ncbi:M67 family metallopeptidase [Pseudalkalibacillus caeni]|uniref:M67 family metallopeptidase n=1 Tax=Exobacillus caeni TaxID=2574798 RepID=A0A5R9F551_9BACL|nr:M67 family metallopeptidase [Pseudalkalibacillus caeni]TLS37466.1 M67 family metallopeptidase [Pseudalkalibacillus caeni]
MRVTNRHQKPTLSVPASLPLPNLKEKEDVAEKDHKRNSGRFKILHSIWQDMLEHCKKEHPYEACGLLSGKDGTVCTIWRMENIHRSRVSFEMDIDEIRRVFELIEKKGEELLGIYHSHPTGRPYPSKDDIQNNNYPEIDYLIVSLAKPKPVVKSFRMKRHKVTKRRIKIIS